MKKLALSIFTLILLSTFGCNNDETCGEPVEGKILVNSDCDSVVYFSLRFENNNLHTVYRNFPAELESFGETIVYDIPKDRFISITTYLTGGCHEDIISDEVLLYGPIIDTTLYISSIDGQIKIFP